MGRSLVIAIINGVLYWAFLLLYWTFLLLRCPTLRWGDRARMVRAFAEEWRSAACGRGGRTGVGLWRWTRADTVANARDEHAWVRRQRARRRQWQRQQREVGQVNIHDPKVHKASGATFKRSLQTLLCLVLMQLSTTAMVDAEHAGLVVLEALMMVVVAASIVGCFVATGLEMWAMGKLGKALLDSRGQGLG